MHAHGPDGNRAAEQGIQAIRSVVRVLAVNAIRTSCLKSHIMSSHSCILQERYDQARFAWLGADVVLETPDTETLTRQTPCTPSSRPAPRRR